MANLLAEILSFGNTARRKLGDLISDPAGVLQMNMDRIMPTQYEQRAEFDRMAGKQHNTAAAQSAQQKMDQLAQDAALNAITVYHGSPHKFDKFDMSKIGTGEGAQAYGHGLYFAESPKVAQEYAKNLSTGGKFVSVGGRDIQPLQSSSKWNPEETAAANLIDADGNFDRAIRRVSNQYEKPGPIISALEKLQKQGATLKDPGNLYKVDIPDESVARFLDWDKPLSQQAPEVRAAVQKLKNHAPEGGIYRESMSPMEFGNMTGEAVERTFTRDLATTGNGNPSNVFSMMLNEYGVPGIRYLDGGSRGTGTGTSNFVVFDDALPTILERNGIPLSDLLQR